MRQRLEDFGGMKPRREKRRFEGDCVRGGQSTLYVTRSDVVEILAMLKQKYPGNMQDLLSEATDWIKGAREYHG